jgi:predicted nucleic acid-binding protein
MTVTPKPRTEITAPRSIRLIARIKRGDRVEFSVSGRMIKIIPKFSPDELQDEREIRDPTVDLQWTHAEVTSRLKLLARVANIVQAGITLEVIAADPDDDRILECAIAGNASLIVTSDRHLARLGSFHGIGTVRPVDLLRTLRP